MFLAKLLSLTKIESYPNFFEGRKEMSVKSAEFGVVAKARRAAAGQLQFFNTLMAAKSASSTKSSKPVLAAKGRSEQKHQLQKQK